MRVIRPWHVPPRIATGAFILNSGLSKRGADAEMAGLLHGMAKGAYPFLGKLEPQQFVKLLSAAEITLGTALLVPIVPSTLAGVGLAAFSGGLLGMYWRTPALHEPGSLKPTQAGIAIAKDSWMFGIAGGLVLEELLDRSRR
jgi:hypothetical protein